MAAAFAGHLLCAAAALVASVVAADGDRWNVGPCPAQAARVPGWAMEAAVRESHEEVPAQLLQMKAAPRQAPLAGRTVGPAVQPEELLKTLPVGWLHVPKCGTTLINTIIHLPGVCPTLPDNLTVCPDAFRQEGCVWPENLEKDYDVPASCPGAPELDVQHRGIKSRASFRAVRGHYMTMLRDPEQKILSAWYLLNAYLDGKTDIEEIASNWTAWGGLPYGRIPNITEFATGYAGCATKLLTRKGFSCSELAPPAVAEVEEAKIRLRTDFSFVGMTGEWELSICLLSAQFKVPCLPAMMLDSGSGGRAHNAERYDTAPLQGVKDPYDRAVFEEGSRIFRESLKKYSVTGEWCRQTCWKDAGIV